MWVFVCVLTCAGVLSFMDIGLIRKYPVTQLTNQFASREQNIVHTLAFPHCQAHTYSVCVSSITTMIS